MTTTCPRHNNVMQFLYVSKNCQVTWLKSPTFGKKSYFKFALNVFLWKNLRARSYFKIIDDARGWPRGKKSYFNPIFTNIFNKHLTNIFPKETFFSKTFQNNFFIFQNNFFPEQTFFSKFYKNRPAAGDFAPRPP